MNRESNLSNIWTRIKSWTKAAVILTTAVAVTTGCSDLLTLREFHSDEYQVLEPLTYHVIEPNLQAFTEATATMNTAIEAFVASPSEALLLEVQQGWKTAQHVWQQSISFQFGPVEDERILNKVNFWPIRESSITEVLDDTDPLTFSDVQEFGATKKGLPVLEYLLFDHEETLATMVSLFTASERRRTYLSLLGQELNANATEILDAWQPSGDDYQTMFINSNDGLNMVLNNLVFTIENVKNSKLGAPMGKSDGGDPQPSDVESQRSEQSLTHILNNLYSIKYVFNSLFVDAQSGDYVDGKGLDDYLDAGNYGYLANDINATLDAIIDQVEAINMPLWQAVNDASVDLETIYDDLSTLLRLVKIDMAAAMNQTIHFNDNDGD